MTDTNSGAENNADVQAVDQLHQQYLQITERMGGVIVGQEAVIEQLLAALLCRGHCILEGVPGLAKTLTVSTLSSLLNQTFRRIQFTPDPCRRTSPARTSSKKTAPPASASSASSKARSLAT